MRLLAVPERKISTVYLGAGGHYVVNESKASARHVARKFGISEAYICAVGTIEPRKNLTTAIEAMKILRGRGDVRHQLVIAGATGWKQSKIYGSIERCGLTQKDVVFLGRVPDEDMPLLYSGAAVFVFPSLYEGFGLPLVEAMACGVPIVASDANPVPEIVEDAAILVSPHSPEGFADAISRVTLDSDLRCTLIGRGLRRASKFRWDTAAEELLRIFEEVHRNLRPAADC
jgi:glycosyltransferase involved in cell wall biosynthesis